MTLTGMGARGIAFLNQYLLPGVRHAEEDRELRVAISACLRPVGGKFIQPVHELLAPQPIAPLINWITERSRKPVKDLVYDEIRENFGVDP